jgi:hypothetical protein
MFDFRKIQMVQKEILPEQDGLKGKKANKDKILEEVHKTKRNQLKGKTEKEMMLLNMWLSPNYLIFN